jgi:hypothetical protein
MDRVPGRLATVTRLIALLATSVALSAVAAPVHVPSVAQTSTFPPSDAWPTIWLPERDAGLSDSSATVFIAGDVPGNQGAPLAFALDGGSIPLTFNLHPDAVPGQESSGWVRHSNMAIGWGMGLGAGPRNVVTTGGYRFLVFDGVGRLDDVSAPSPPSPRLGNTDATTIYPGVIYAAYLQKVNAYHPILQDGGITYDTNFTGGSAQGSQASFPDYVTAVTQVPNDGLLVAVRAGQVRDAGALFTVAYYLDTPTTHTEVLREDGGQLGAKMEGLDIYHASNVGDGGQADWALVSTDGRLLLYQVKPTFSFITELVIDSANPTPYFKGIAISNLPLGPYDKGVVVVFNADNAFATTGQLLFARWDDIVSAVDAGLVIDTSFDPRTYAPGGGGGGGGGGGNGTPGLSQPPLGSGISSHNEFSGSCGGVPPPLTVVGALIALAGLARGRRRR